MMKRMVLNSLAWLGVLVVLVSANGWAEDAVDPFGGGGDGATADPFGAPVEEAPAEDAPVAELDITPEFFAEQVWPIFEATCVSCHGESRQRGALRLDSPRAIRAGGAGGEVLAAGNPDASPLYTLTILPADHPDIMPGSGDPLTKEQTEIIRQWILAGADFGSWEGPMLASVPDGDAPAESAAQFARSGLPQGPDYVEVLAKDVAPAPAEALTKLQEAGALAMPLARDNNLLRVDFNLQGAEISDEHLALLEAVADHVTWLNLARTSVSDAGLAVVAKLPKLTRLHLEHTGVTDAGLAHLSGLSELRYLNLFNTQVSDAGLDHLIGLPHLERLFLWQTQATPAGAEKLLAALPSVDVNMGWEAPAAAEEAPASEEVMSEETPTEEAPAEETESADDVASLFDEGSCCAVAVAAASECEHPCCVEARNADTVCLTCNPGAAAKLSDA